MTRQEAGGGGHKCWTLNHGEGLEFEKKKLLHNNVATDNGEEVLSQPWKEMSHLLCSLIFVLLVHLISTPTKYHRGFVEHLQDHFARVLILIAAFRQESVSLGLVYS